MSWFVYARFAIRCVGLVLHAVVLVVRVVDCIMTHHLRRTAVRDPRRAKFSSRVAAWWLATGLSRRTGPRRAAPFAIGAGDVDFTEV